MLDIELPVLDEKATKKNVLAALYKYRIYLKSDKGNKERKNYIKKMNEALYRLESECDRIIIRKYMFKSKVNRFELIRELNLSEGDYYRKRNQAFYNYAYELGIDIMKNER
ncbi:TPA: ArpU family transcriptional regulator [Bacillus cereus]|nr:ArpU family transcriptional regulator [Bacillus cereus]HDW8010064.1 ArpU family transcriptional regulator [Bacillus cereus]HDW8015164.1 ArpU family transcriptional regulator [Bacillus cereus]HDW8019414.1 ArpU family transcriptional regulator [Bacillus cereus]HDW8026577.1 ArpU family transcriptional regulator [Bacillus cereus]